MTIALNDPSFWRQVDQGLGTVQQDPTLGLHYVVLDFEAEMRIIVRTAEELFTTTASREGARARVVVNGNYYGVSTAGLVDAQIGHDPVAASHTAIEGRLVSGGTVVGGSSEPNMFYFAQLNVPRVPYAVGYDYTSGFGDPPLGRGGHAPLRAAIGGVGPLIIDGLRYGDRNLYGAGAPSGAPVSGAPPAAARRFLTQRSNATFASAESRPGTTGKTVLAAAVGRWRVLVGVQAHGASPGGRYATLRDRLAALGFEHAVFLDGSDSSMMMVGGRWVVRPGEDKSETNVVGVAFF